MGEVHLIGRVLGASDFGEGVAGGLFCKWSVQTGGAWRLLSGLREGQTQVDAAAADDGGGGGGGAVAHWSHPVDAHYATKGLQGWPKFVVQVFRQDGFGRNDLVGYGFCHLPTSPGTHTIDVATWRPAGSFRDSVAQHYLGGGHQLRNPDLLIASSDRHRLTTTAAGRVHLQLSVVLRNFEKYGVEF